MSFSPNSVLGGKRTKKGFNVLWSFSMGSCCRARTTQTFSLPHPFYSGKGVCHADPLTLPSHTWFTRRLWVLADMVLGYLDPQYKEGGWCLYASCKDDAAEIDWHQDKFDVDYQYWVKLGCFENEFVDFGGREHGDYTRTFFGSRKEGDPYPVLKCDTRGWHRIRKPDFEGIGYSVCFFKMFDSRQTSLPPRFWPPVMV